MTLTGRISMLHLHTRARPHGSATGRPGCLIDRQHPIVARTTNSEAFCVAYAECHRRARRVHSMCV